MEDALSTSLGRTRSATAASVRVWSAATGTAHSHSRARTSGSAARGSGRVIANTDQVYALKQFLERAGPDATTKEIEAVAAETGLDGKWIRQWIKRQVNGNRGKSKKVKQSSGSSTGETSTSRGLSPEGSFAPLLPHKAAGQELANPGAGARKFTFVALEGFEAGPRIRQHSGQSVTGSAMATSGLVSLSSPAAGYDWSKSPLLRDYQDGPLYPQAHSSPMHTADPGASFTAPFRSEATYQHTTAVSSPDFHVDAVQWSTYKTTYPQSIREAELFASAAPTIPHYDGSGLGPSGSYASPTVSTTVFPSMTPGPALQDRNVPDCLTAGSAYLYRLFHEVLADAPPGAPPETPLSDGGVYMAGLTRPSNTTDGRLGGAPPSSATLLSTSVSMLSPVVGYAAYPVAYQTRFCDLVHLTKTLRGDADKHSGPSTSTHVIPETTLQPSTFHCSLPILIETNNPCFLTEQKTPTTCWGCSPSCPVLSRSDVDPTQSDFLRVVVRAASSDAQEEGETEDEHEVVTPCEVADLALPLNGGKGKGKGKATDAQVVIVEALNADRT
ncbi:hypothetical protein LXA43DRAFT_1179271 [Ganoderma leucocontextum]|nr:hypothetical protein LXA43DRAFT_1179271 [Ganoderma leucocontextum]